MSTAHNSSKVDTLRKKHEDNIQCYNDILCILNELQGKMDVIKKQYTELVESYNQKIFLFCLPRHFQLVSS